MGLPVSRRSVRGRALLAAGWLIAFATAGPGAAFEAGYLKLEGGTGDRITGEAKDPGYEGWIKIDAFHQGVQGSAGPRTLAAGALRDLAETWRRQIRLSGGTAGGPQFGELVLSKQLDRASPGLALACAGGEFLRKAQLDLVRTTPRGVLLARIELEHARVSSLQNGGVAEGGGPISETVMLTFSDIKFASVEIEAKGGLLAHTAHWDLEQGKGDFDSIPLPGTGGGGGDPQPQLILGQNLLVNPGAESGPAPADLLGVVPPEGWLTTGPLTALPFGIAGGAFDASVPGPDDRGEAFFAGGPDSALSLARQVIDVSETATLADAHRLEAVLDGWLGGVGKEEDQAEVIAAFRQSDGTTLGTLGIGPVTGRDRRFKTGLVFTEHASRVPPGTRNIEVTVRITRFTGPYNDGAADNLRLVLVEGDGRPAKLPLRVLFSSASDPHVVSKIRCSWPARFDPVVIENSTRLDGDWTVANPLIQVEGEERSFEVPVDAAQGFRFWRIRARN